MIRIIKFRGENILMRILFGLIFLSASLTWAQDYNFSNTWQNLGPEEKPYEVSRRSATGIGPVEFIRVYQKEQGHLLAGSLWGGLFYSSDNGESWINSGSDSWQYSTCGWADFYPEDKATWFAYTSKLENNGSPGNAGRYGGIMRTKDAGFSWEQIGDLANLTINEYAVIYGIRFNPNNAKMMYLLSDNGIIYTEDCMADQVQWKRMEGVAGKVYDMDFVNEQMYVSNASDGRWKVLTSSLTDCCTFEEIALTKSISEKIETITMEPRGKNLLLLMNYTTAKDELVELDLQTNRSREIVSSLRVIFGMGNTIAVNPFTQDDVWLGTSTSIRHYDLVTGKQMRSGTKFHPDCEFVAFDPFDTSTVYLATHGGVYISYDGGMEWNSKSNGLGIAEVTGMSVAKSNPNEIVIGTFHDGSSVYADFNQDGNYFWQNVNGGDALIPFIDPENPGIIYTTTQFNGGGIYYSTDTGRTNVNVHSYQKLNTSGWEMAACLHPQKSEMLFFNFAHKYGEDKNNVDIVRTNQPAEKGSADTLSNFRLSHDLESYRVYGLFNSEYHPDELYAYVLHFENVDGQIVINHLLFKNDNCMADPAIVRTSWYQLELPRNDWIADVTVNPKKSARIYVSYVSGREDHLIEAEGKGMIYYLKYKKGILRKSVDISRNIPNGLAGKYNLTTIDNDSKSILIGTRFGVFYGGKKMLKGKGDWEQVGFGLPHCKIYGIDYNSETGWLTVGTMGRGVWRCQM